MTAREFVDGLWVVYDEKHKTDNMRYVMEDKLTRYVVKDKLKYVLSNIAANEEITRNQAAKILHTFIRDVLRIPDISDENVLQKATELKDLYDCRTCVSDIVQVYVRGIMDAGYVIKETGMKMFGGRELLAESEWSNIRHTLKCYLFSN